MLLFPCSKTTTWGFMVGFLKVAEMIEVSETYTVCRDPKDDKLLELAVSGKADFLVTGDKDLLVLNPFRKRVTQARSLSFVIIVRLVEFFASFGINRDRVAHFFHRVRAADNTSSHDTPRCGSTVVMLPNR